MAVLRVGIVGCGEVTQVMHLPSLYQRWQARPGGKANVHEPHGGQ